MGLVPTAPIPTVLAPLVEYAARHPTQVGAIVTALAGAATHYSKTGTLPIGRLPLRHLHDAARELGDQYFGRARPTGVPGIVVDAPPDAIEQALRERHYEGVDTYSYEYASEALTLRRPSDTRTHPKTGAAIPMETHPRGFRLEDGRTLIICHDEASRFEAPRAHVDEAILSWERGRDIVAEDIEAAQLSHTRIESERAAEVTVVAPES